MARIKDSNYYVTSGWMINRLGLSGRELQVYAIIYGFTQDAESEFNGSITYLTEWLGTSNRNTVTRTIKALVDKGLIDKRQVENNGVTTNYYKAILPPPDLTSTKTVLGSTKMVQGQYQNGTRGSTKMVLGGSTEMVPNNYINKDINNNKDISLKPLEEKPPDKTIIPYEKIRNLYNETCKSFPKCLKISPNREKAIAARWKQYDGNIAEFVRLFTIAEASDFLKGQNNRNWQADFDWLLKPNNMPKVLEGKYTNKGGAVNARTNGSGTPGTYAGASGVGTNAIVGQAELEEQLRATGQFKGYPDFNAMFSQK